MSQPTHTYGPTCHLAQTVSFSGSNGNDDIPDLKAHFFYASPLPIDDPLSPAPIPTGSDSKSVKHTPRPFSAYDNNALEEAWLGLSSGQGKKNHRRSKSVSPIKEDQKRGGKKNDKSPEREIGVESLPEACACKPSHSSCKNNRNKCNCPSCPQNPTFASASRNAKPSPVSTSIRGASKDSNGHVTKESTDEAPKIQQADERGNPYNRNCDDAHHIPMDSQVPSCCGDLEVDDRMDHNNCVVNSELNQPNEESGQDTDPKALKRGKSEKKNKAGLDGVEMTQRDGADDKPAPQDPQFSDELNSKEHRAFERHEQSKGHEDFETHLKSKHQGSSHDQYGNESQSQSQKSTEKFAKTQPVASEDSSKKASEKPSKAAMVETDTNVPKTKSSKKKDGSGLSLQSSDAMPGNVPVQSGDAGTTGSPFVKLPSRTSSQQPSDHDGGGYKTSDEVHPNSAGSARRSHERDSIETETVNVHGCKAHRNNRNQVDVPVGVSRLHLVQLPALQMQPIYWSPVHDMCAVSRGTWFYKDTMYPVEPPVANQLESGYRELRPWSQTWDDELNSAIEVGAAGEEKIAHCLWPEEEQKPKSRKGPEHHPLSNDPYCAAMCFHGEVAAEGTVDPDDTDKKSPASNVIVKRYSKSQVIYKDAQNAFILKPNLQPSAYYGRKPLQKIRKGATVGIHVVRGFDWKVWEKLHPSKKTNASRKAEENAPVAGDTDTRKRNACAACRAQEEQYKVTDLCFVIHGIGQKLSESMESFHFTHAINAFRRSVNVELGNEAVQRVLRKDLGGVMVLPINWRSKVSLHESGPVKDGDRPGHGADFSMKDITPPTIPAVRDFIEKVMLDIPYWMSIHKPKMIEAVITEANRVYRLWCKNNPEFHKEGRVHIIAHSLGSAMALEILSNQPTSTPKLNLNSKKMNTKCFDFQTTNLFFCGSPAGFFLYLEKGCLIPRRGLSKPGAEPGDEQDKAIVGDVGTYGCLAVDNVYNVMHPEDPIAYQVNATVDLQYAASIKRAQVPSATTSFFESIGNAMRSMKPGASPATNVSVGQLPKPAGMNRLPSQLEMEVHDFTREEIAEKKFLLLNDNGQIDYFLGSDSGPLSFQYINMLSAHSCYWENSDFIRLVVVEVGRKPGRSYCLPSMKAVKIGHKPQKAN